MATVMSLHVYIGLETYAHRIGRTGRFGKKGTAVTLVDGRQDKQVLDMIQSHYGTPVEEVKANDQDIKAKAGQAAK
jgi:ATP-dependent RNA helicase DDX19/DBP5